MRLFGSNIGTLSQVFSFDYKSGYTEADLGWKEIYMYPGTLDFALALDCKRQ